MNQDFFNDFVNSVIFIHDDISLQSSSEKYSNLNWIGSNPFYIGAKVCVTDTLAGFGEKYIDYLKSLNCFPENILIPHSINTKNDLLSKLCSDNYILKKLCYMVENNRLDISTFYSEKVDILQHFLMNISTHTHNPIIHPSIDAFKSLNDRIISRKWLQEIGIPIPDGVICESMKDLINFYLNIKAKGNSIIIKKYHYGTIKIKNEHDIYKYVSPNDFPLIAEKLYDVKSSPISHSLCWKGENQILFIVKQIISQFRHQGNITPHNLQKKQILAIENYTKDILSSTNQFQGVIGIDFIITEEDDIFVVDVNPRFNYSTYPYVFLKKMNINIDNIYTKYRSVFCNIENLSTLLSDADFTPFDQYKKSGILMMSPAFHPVNNKVVHFFILIVANNKKQLINLEQRFLNLLYTKYT